MATYNSNSHRVEIVDLSSYPTWRQGLTAWQWTEISGTNQANHTVTPTQTGGRANRVNAWNGMAVNTVTGRLYQAANGGHADYGGNEVLMIDLTQDSPAWSTLLAPSAVSDYTIDQVYYSDGKPSSTHSYYAQQIIRSRNRLFRVGSGSNWGTGNFQDPKMHAFNLGANAWDSAGAFQDVANGGDSYSRGYAICQHPTTEDIYVACVNRLWRFDTSANQWDQLAAWPSGSGSSVYGRASAVNPNTNKILFFGDAYNLGTGGLEYDITGNTFSEIDFTGPQSTAFGSRINACGHWDEDEGAFLVKSSTGGVVYSVNPSTYAVSIKATTGSPPDCFNGCWGRFMPVSVLGGYVMMPVGNGNLWFLPTE